MRIKSFLSHICLHIRTDLYLYGLQPGKWVLVKVQWCSVGATYIKRMLGACCKTCIFLTEASLFYLLVSFLWVCLNIFIIVNFLSVSARFWPRAMSIPFPGWMSCEVTIPGFSFFVCLLLLHCLLGLLMHDCFCYVRFRFFSTMLSNWLERTSLKWPIFVELDVKTWIVGISAVGCQKNTKFPVICQVILCNWSLVYYNMLTLSNIVYDNGDRLSASFNQMRWFGKNSNLSILGHRNMELSLYDH